jgi:hypothetical protein
MIRRAARATDGGETLIESVISTMLLGVAVLAIIGAVFTGVILSGGHRSVTTADVAVKTIAEGIQAATYVSGATTYSPNTAPSGYTATVLSVKCVPPLLTTVSVADLTSCTPTDSGLQFVAVQVSAVNGGAFETVGVMKRKP